MVLTELGETCEDRRWLPIISLAECKASSGYFQTYYQSYVFAKEVDERYYPKGCYVLIRNDKKFPPLGYFNKHQSGDSHSARRTLCTTSGGKKL